MARIITNVSDVPDGWVRIADITDSVTDQKILSDAHNADVLPAVRLVRTTSEFRIGPVWVDPAAAKTLLQRCQAKRDGRLPCSPAADEPAHLSHHQVALVDRVAKIGDAIVDAIDRGTAVMEKLLEKLRDLEA